jgi:hypothetical protein
MTNAESFGRNLFRLDDFSPVDLLLSDIRRQISCRRLRLATSSSTYVAGAVDACFR